MKSYLLLRYTVIVFLFISTLTAQHIPSGERSDPTVRAMNQLETNNIRTSVFNWGPTGRIGGVPITEQTPYEWYKNTGQVYLALMGPCIGAEVVDENDNTIHIVDIFNYRYSPDGRTWNFEPIPGYFNQDNFNIASSDNPSTWPSFWPDRLNDASDPGWSGSWDGYFGKNVIINGQELYFKFTDDLYDKFSYYPDTTDLTRKGLGLIVSGRALSFNEDFLKDIVFYSYKINNDGTKPLNKTGISFLWADFVGGEGQGNMLGYDLSKNFIWSFNEDNKSPDPAFYDEPVGCIGLSVLKFPEDGLSLNNIQYVPVDYFPTISGDEKLWNWFFTPDSIVDTNSLLPGDYNAYAGINYFSLQPGETKEILLAVSFANGPFADPNHSIRKSRITGQYFAALAATKGNFNFNAYSVDVNHPANGQVFTNTVNINWSTDGATNRIADYLYYSIDNGDNWNFLTVDSSQSGNYTWDTENFPDGILYKIRIISVSENGIAIGVSDGIFEINKNNINALPQVYITNPPSNSRINGEYIVSLISGDADNDPTEVGLFYKLGKYYDWQSLSENIQNNYYEFYTRELPNTPDLFFKAIVTSNSDSGSYQVKHIEINNSRPIFSDSTLSLYRKTPATGLFEVKTVNQQELTGDDYETVFEVLNTSLVYDVVNLTTGVKLLDSITETNGDIEGPYFEGLRLFIKNVSLEEIDSLSGWNNPGIFSLNFGPPSTSLWLPERSDYKIEIKELGADTSLYWVYHTNSQNIIMPSIPVNFKIFNISEGRYINFAFYERNTTGGNGYFTIGDRIFLLESSQNDTLISTYQLYPDECDSCRNPVAGDIYYHYITKPFYAGDSVFFSTRNITDVDDVTIQPDKFSLEQNYPNPFNPTTKIRFEVPVFTHVLLEVYDVLGRKIITLINREMNAGIYETEFNGLRLASGVYFYRFKAGNYISAKKMILLR